MFSSVTERHEAALIVASGPSARGFRPPGGVPVIAVNGVIEWIDRADYWFSLDPSPENRFRMQHPREGTRYYCACPDNVPLPNHVRRLQRLTGPGPWSARYRLSDRPDAIHTGNSAWGALGLAHLMGCKRVVLVGVDASTETRCEGGRSLCLKHLPDLFASAMDQVDVVSAGGLASVPQKPLPEAIAWLLGNDNTLRPPCGLTA